LPGAIVTVEAFHNSLSGNILRAELTPSDVSGVYRADMPMQHNGRWELRFTAENQGHRLTYSETRHLFVEGNWQ
jgi:hypothetical protein